MFIRYFIFLLCLFTANVHAQDYYDDYGYGDDYGYDEYADEYADDEYGYDDEVVENSNTQGILQTYRSPFIINPENPTLPPNHHISRLKGTVWRSDDTILKTNSRGVISEQRLYIFFNKYRDAISYQYIEARKKDTPIWPEDSLFIALKPIIRTNTVQTNTIIEIVTNRVMEIIINQAQYGSSENTEQQNSSEHSDYDEGYSDYDDEYSDYDDSEGYSDYDDEYSDYDDSEGYSDYDEGYYDEYYSLNDTPISDMPIRLLAQNFNNLEPQYLLNLGRAYGGVFIHETGDIRFPYKVIILQMDQSGAYLYEYNYDTNTPAEAQNIQPPTNNMKRFQRVILDREFLY